MTPGNEHDAQQRAAARRARRRRAPGSVDAMSAEVAIVAGTGGALGHATAATLAVGGRPTRDHHLGENRRDDSGAQADMAQRPRSHHAVLRAYLPWLPAHARRSPHATA
jgi:hypothetical protein